MKKSQRTMSWMDLSEEQILQMRVRDFNLRISESPLDGLIQRLHSELDAKGIRFRPPCYLADEWLCPDKVPIIGIPFWLAHPRLKQIEQKMMFEVEGGTEQECMKLLRHECGHALNYAYKLYARTRWRELFGAFSSRYADSYPYQPYSRRYVIHLEDNYAQAHPDDDFAETFAVWLTPSSNWERKYQQWPVMKKLLYVDRLTRKIGNEPPVVVAQGRLPWSASRMTSTLAAYYERKRRALGAEFQGYYDDSLRRLFSAAQANPSQFKASRLLREHRRALVDSVAQWTGHRKYDIDELVNRLMKRSDALDLWAKEDQVMPVAVLVTAIASNTLRVPSRRSDHE